MNLLYYSKRDVALYGLKYYFEKHMRNPYYIDIDSQTHLHGLLQYQDLLHACHIIYTTF